MLMAIRYRTSATWGSLACFWTASSPMRSTCDRLLFEPGKRQAYCVRRRDSLRATVWFSVGVLKLMSYHLLSIVPLCGRQQLRHIFRCLTELCMALAVMLLLIWLIGRVLVLCRCFGRFCMIAAIQCTQWCLDACAQKTTATAIFKPVSRPPISQWRMAGQPTQPARVIPHVECHVITILCLL